MEILLVAGLTAAVIAIIVATRYKTLAHDNEMSAVRDLLDNRGPLLPSWFHDIKERNTFFDGVAKLTQRGGLSLPLTEAVLSNVESNRPIFAYAAKLEYYGSTFTEQQLLTSTFLLTTWYRLNDEERANIAHPIATQHFA